MATAMDTAETEKTTEKVFIQGYQVFCNAAGTNEDSALEKDPDDLPVTFEVKSEPIDPSYEKTTTTSPSNNDSPAVSTPAENSPRSETTSTPPPATPPAATPSADTPTNVSEDNRAKKPVLTSLLTTNRNRSRQLKDVLPRLKQRIQANSATRANAIDDLVKKNEYVLSQNNTGSLKPNQRKVRQDGKTPEVQLDSSASQTFLVSPSSQGRISTYKPENESSAKFGKILRPRSPTRKCSIPEKDKSHFNYALIESSVKDKDSDRIFKVQSHEMVCAATCPAMFMSPSGSLVSKFDLQFYWCNFCSFHTTNKSQLIQHSMEHRFHCKHCRYQSFSRADIIHHSTKEHPDDFKMAANTLKYCILLSDHLQIYSQDTEEDRRKREGSKPDDAPPEKCVKLEGKSVDSLSPDELKTLQNDYQIFEMDVENMEEQNSNDEPNNIGEPILSDKDVMSAYVAGHIQNNSNGPLITNPTAGRPRMQSILPQPNTPRTSFGNQRGKSVTGSNVSSSLYWSCGYCTFTSQSQSEIKEHSQKHHRGKPHRYVALIMPTDKQTGNGQAPIAGSQSIKEKSVTMSGHQIEIDNAEDMDVYNNDNDTNSYKCFHCAFLVKQAGLLKEHLLIKHPSLSMVGVDIFAHKKKNIFYCPRQDCPFRSKTPTAFQTHTEMCTPWFKRDMNVTVEKPLLDCLENTIKFSKAAQLKEQKLEQQERAAEEQLGTGKGYECAVPTCSVKQYNSDGEMNTGMHFFRFPQGEYERNKWCDIIKRPQGQDGFKVTSATRICHHHFGARHIRKMLSGYWELKPLAEPTLNLPSY